MITELETYAQENRIPIMQPDGIKFLTNYIAENNVKTILEIGTAIGYSAIKMALVNPDIKIVSLERDTLRYNLALENIAKFNLQNQIKVIWADALEIEVEGSFDLIFIDAAKSQSIKFFEKFKKNLKANGTIITDNINFHGLTKKMDIKSRRTRALVRKINEYVKYLEDLDDFTTYFVPDGDGISISKPK